jgi:hypothetical protein
LHLNHLPINRRGRNQVGGGPNSAFFNDALIPLFVVTSPAIWSEKEKYKAQCLMSYGTVEEPYEEARYELAKKLWEASDGRSCSRSLDFIHEIMRVLSFYGLVTLEITSVSPDFIGRKAPFTDRLLSGLDIGAAALWLKWSG